MKNFKYKLLSLFAVLGLLFVPVSVGAINVFQPCDGVSDSSVCSSVPTDDISVFIRTIVNALLFILGAVSVIIIISSGIRYVTSHGDPGNVKVAKDTLLYAVIGLIVALTAYAIVNFVVGFFWD